jgi:CheY-like chemotaxis protein
LQEVQELMAVNAQKKGLELSIKIEPELKRYFIGDTFRLKQILLNLIGNAIKFTEQGFVKVYVTQWSDSMQLRFCIEDSGIGLSAAQCETIFQAFGQADSSTTRRFGGTGLGTTIAQQLVILMGGKLWVESTEGQGSRFYFTVTLTAADAQQIAALEVALLQPIICKRKLNILLVEDIEENSFLVQTRLQQQQHQVTVAQNGLDAVAAFQQQPFDLILMDINMPKLDGLQATQRIRHYERHRAEKIPIIAMTASIMIDERQKYLDGGMDAIVGKPIDFNDLFSTIARLIKQNPDTVANDISLAEMSVAKSEEFPVFIHIDVKEVLHRWQSITNYQRGLKIFLQRYSDFEVQVLLCLEQSDFEKIYKLNHALKGVSGNFSILNVFKISSAIEAAFHQQNTAQVEVLLPDLINAVKNVNIEIKAWLEPDTE